jgi:uncharacterized caspase-like protein
MRVAAVCRGLAGRLIAVLAALTLPLLVAHAQGRGVSPIAADSPQRIALLIGNTAYRHTTALRNPSNDVEALAPRLERLGFEVIAVVDADKRQMLLALDQFRRAIRRGAVGLFFYSGHGLQYNGVNWLVPVDAAIERKVLVESEAIDADRVLREMDAAGARLKLVILDACRTNPFARSWRSTQGRGLAAMTAAVGTVIAYATGPGSVASDGAAGENNGLYTSALLAALDTPGLTVEQLFKRVRETVIARSNGAQTPWESSSLTGELVLNEGRFASAVTDSAAAGNSTSNAQSSPAAQQGVPLSANSVRLRFDDLAARTEAIAAYFDRRRREVEGNGGVFRVDVDARVRALQRRMAAAIELLRTGDVPSGSQQLDAAETDLVVLERIRKG